MISTDASAPPTTGSRRSASADARRRQFLDAALDEFLARGYHGASTRRISAAVGTSPGLFFHYFDSKESVYDELVALGYTKLHLDLDAATADPLGHLLEAAEGALSMVRRDRRLARMFVFMAAAERTPGTTSRSAELLAEHDLVARCVPVIEAGQARGVIRAGDPLSLSVAFWGAVHGVVETLGARADGADPQAAWLGGVLTDTGEGRS